MAVEIIPAILSKTSEDFSSKLGAVLPHVKRVQIDVMDGEFVPNKTLDVEKFPAIPAKLLVEYHLMVEDPLEYVKKIGRKGAIYELHVESLEEVGIGTAIGQVKKMGGRVALAISPDTPVEMVEPYLKQIEFVLVMTVYPGFSGQKYIAGMEEKMKWLRKKGAVVEVDGGLDIGMVKSAARAGATLIGVASGIFAKPDIGKAIEELREDAER